MHQALARKWRPKQFDEVVGQPGVTRTLRNMIGQERIAQAFVFAGPRGVGKTTTARLLARALNCQAVEKPTPDPCGACDACREIWEGRDIDVLEIDAATHTQVDNVREVIIAGLGLRPVRDRYKIFIIDEVHQLSQHSFNALLKSLEEPPPHVVFIMATTELAKIPDTIRSRAQEFEFRAIGSRAIADQLRRIAEAERIDAEDAALVTIARAAEGSLRDAESALDQVIAFAGGAVTQEDVEAVLGLIARDLPLAIAEAVVAEDAGALLQHADRAVEAGLDPKNLCRELSRLVRDLMVISLDPERLEDPEIAQESERDRLRALAGRFSREDLMRAFDLLLRAEADVRAASEPRYALEMSLLRWVQLRKLVPLEEVIAGLEKGGGPPPPGAAARAATSPIAPGRPRAAPPAAPPARPAPAPDPPRRTGPVEPGAPGLKDAFLAEIRRSKQFFYNAVVAQAQRIECEPDRVTFTFAPVQRALRSQVDQNAGWLEGVIEALAGRRLKVTSALSAAEDNGGSAAGDQPPAPAATPADRKAALREQALADAGVQAMIDVFGAEIRDVEEIDP